MVEGAFDGKLVSGTVTVHNPHTAYGDCKGTGKFIRAKGVRIVTALRLVSRRPAFGDDIPGLGIREVHPRPLLDFLDDLSGT